jgi:cation:H+ antiporter
MDVVIQIVGGLVLLGLGGEGIVRGAVVVARRLGLTELMIGITLVGFGASLPELLTSLNAATRDAPGISVGIVIGSNISNVLLILGLAALVRPLPCDQKALERDGAALLLLSVAIAAWSIFAPAINWIGGLVMLACLAFYIFTTYRTERRAPESPAAIRRQGEAERHKPLGLPLAAAIVLASIGALIFGADLLVKGGVALAHNAGVPETFIGLTVIAVGTSLPELAACVIASLRGRADLAFGAIVGSCIYNVLGVLGATALVAPVRILADFSAADWLAFVGAPVLLVGHAATSARITRLEGGFMVALYGLYVWYLFTHIAPDFSTR